MERETQFDSLKFCARNPRKFDSKAREGREKVQFSRILTSTIFTSSAQTIYALTMCYMTPTKPILFVCVFFFRSFALVEKSTLSLKGKIKVGAEKNLKKYIFFLEWPRARDEKSRLEFFHFIKKNRHSSGSAVVSCLRLFMVNSRTFSELLASVKKC